jgi:glycosyltransferase involved in cell wall biosynthesis
VTVVTADTPDIKSMKSFDADLSGLKIYRPGYFDLRRTVNKLFRTDKLVEKNIGAEDEGRPGRPGMVEAAIDLINRPLSGRGILFGSTRIPTFSDLWLWPAYKTAKRIISREDTDVIITTSPPPVSNLVGLYLKRWRRDIVWVADLRDLWTQHPNHRGVFPFTVFENALEKKCVGASDAVITVSEVMAQKLKDKYPDKGSRIFCIENGYDEESFGGPFKEAARTDPSKKILVYAGALYEFRRNPEIIFRVLNRRGGYWKDKIEVVFYGSYETKRVLDKFLGKYPSAGGSIRYGGFLSFRQIISAQQRADALLFIEDDSRQDGVLTGKIFEYMAFRKPILCLGVTAKTYVGTILQKTGLCTFFGRDMDKFEDGLRRLVEEELEIKPQEEFIRSFSRFSQVKKLDRIIADCLKK